MDLRQRIVSQLIAGYLGHLMVAENPVLQPTTEGPEHLFSIWIPIIYSSALPASFGPSTLQSLAALSLRSFEEHQFALQIFGIKGGGLFRPDHTATILYHFSLAGFGLRAMETRRLS